MILSPPPTPERVCSQVSGIRDDAINKSGIQDGMLKGTGVT